MADIPIRLSLKRADLEALCAHLTGDAGHPARTLAGIDALQLLLAHHTEPEDRQGEAYAAMHETLARHADAARKGLLRQRAARLCQALAQEDAAAVAEVHGALSREAFFAMAAALPAANVESGATWVSHWYTEAGARARAASPYPDAMDWARAGIALEELIAMQDLAAAFTAAGPQPPIEERSRD